MLSILTIKSVIEQHRELIHITKFRQGIEYSFLVELRPDNSMKIYRETRGAHWRKRKRRGKRKLVSRTEIAAENPVESSWQKKIEFPTVYAALHHHPRRAICNVYNRPPEDKTNLCVTETRRNFFAGPTADYNPGYQTTLRCSVFQKKGKQKASSGQVSLRLIVRVDEIVGRLILKG